MCHHSTQGSQSRLSLAASVLVMLSLSALCAGPPGRSDEPALDKIDQKQQIRPGDARAHGLAPRDLDELRTILRTAVEKKTVPGVSLILVHRGETIFKEAFGNLATDQRVQMASSAKPVTASLLLILADQGKLSLDDAIEKYLPEFRGIKVSGKAPARPPTARQLLCNMSGLPGDLKFRAGKDDDDAEANGNRTGNGAPRSRRRGGRNHSLADSVRSLAEGGLRSEPGSEFHYCTLGFNAAARVAEVVAGKPFEQLIAEELFEPLGMRQTRYVPMGAGAFASKPALPNGESRYIMAGGGLTSTLDDFAAFYQMHLNGGTYRGRRVLSEKAVVAMHTRQIKLLPMSGPYGKDYGLAFFLDRLDPEGRARVVGHAGMFGTTPWLDKDRDLVGVLLVQSNFLRVMPLVMEIQSKVRAMIPVSRASESAVPARPKP
jgi:CubicO group peptidase (beta-lactamase class C family)